MKTIEAVYLLSQIIEGSPVILLMDFGYNVKTAICSTLSE